MNTRQMCSQCYKVLLDEYQAPCWYQWQKCGWRVVAIFCWSTHFFFFKKTAAIFRANRVIWMVVVRTTFCAILRLWFCVMCVVWQSFLRDHRLSRPMFAFSRTVMPDYGWVIGRRRHVLRWCDARRASSWPACPIIRTLRNVPSRRAGKRWS